MGFLTPTPLYKRLSEKAGITFHNSELITTQNVSTPLTVFPQLLNYTTCKLLSTSAVVDETPSYKKLTNYIYVEKPRRETRTLVPEISP